MERTKRLGVDLFTSGQISKICGVAPRTASKWIDAGKLKGYRIPGSNDRRVERAELVAFMVASELPLNALPGGGGAGGGRILAVGLTADQRAAVAGLAVNGYAVAVDAAADEFDAWVKFMAIPPEVVVVSAAEVSAGRLADLLWRVRAVAGERVHVVAVGCEYDTEDGTAKLAEVCDAVVPFPHTPEQVAVAVAGWRSSLPTRANCKRKTETA